MEDMAGSGNAIGQVCFDDAGVNAAIFGGADGGGPTFHHDRGRRRA
jgi:hypothetical protein